VKFGHVFLKKEASRTDASTVPAVIMTLAAAKHITLYLQHSEDRNAENGLYWPTGNQIESLDLLMMRRLYSGTLLKPLMFPKLVKMRIRAVISEKK
jgi:hypothetical protein